MPLSAWGVEGTGALASNTSLPQLFGVAGVPIALIQERAPRGHGSHGYLAHSMEIIAGGGGLSAPLSSSPASFVSCCHPRMSAAVLSLRLGREGRASPSFHNLAV